MLKPRLENIFFFQINISHRKDPKNIEHQSNYVFLAGKAVDDLFSLPKSVLTARVSRIENEDTQELEVNTTIGPNSNIPRSPTSPFFMGPSNARAIPSFLRIFFSKAIAKRGAKEVESYQETCQLYTTRLKQAVFEIIVIKAQQEQILAGKQRINNDFVRAQRKSEKKIYFLRSQLNAIVQNQQTAQALVDSIDHRFAEMLNYYFKYIERGMFQNHQELKKILENIGEKIFDTRNMEPN